MDTTMSHLFVENATLITNISAILHICAQMFRAIQQDLHQDDGKKYCNSTWDQVSCWPTTLAGHRATVYCPDELDGIKFDSSKTATRMCYENATWQKKSDYSQCKPLSPDDVYDSFRSAHNYIVRIIYYVGFSFSIVALLIALFIFLYFRSLRCIRNTIHCHLMVTFILNSIMWFVLEIVTHGLMDDTSNPAAQILCRTLVALFNYLQVTNFFWMLVEGLYLHTMIVWAFSIEKIKFWYCFALGWGAPALVTISWVIVKSRLEDKSCWLPMDDSHFDYIYIAPILFVLLLNLIFLITIVWVLVRKLRAPNTLQTRQYGKAVKATIILIPLLGVDYVILITPPGDDPISKTIFVYFNAVTQSTQGLAVAIFYCFFNGEVRSAIRQRFSRWQEGRTITSRYTRASVASGPEQLSFRINPPVNAGVANGRPTSLPRSYSQGINDRTNYVSTPMLAEDQV